MQLKKRMVYTIAFAGVLVCVLAPIVVPRGVKEPTFNGKALSDWIELVNDSDAETASRAAYAVKQIGTNGFPFLFECIRNPLSTHSTRYRVVESADRVFGLVSTGFRVGPVDDKKGILCG